jgi:hypothetical protein
MNIDLNTRYKEYQLPSNFLTILLKRLMESMALPLIDGDGYLAIQTSK